MLFSCKNKTMKNILVSGYIGFDNFGDEAIFYALETHLKSLGYNVSVLCANKAKVQNNYQVKAYNYKKPFQILKAILKCDTLISGGGSLLQNKTSNFSLYYYLFIILLAKAFFKKVIIFAQGIESINGFLNIFITKAILKKLDYICVRDYNSSKLLKSWGIENDIVADPVYSLLEQTEIEKNKEGLVIQLRDSSNFTDDILESIAISISKYNTEKNIKVFSLHNKYDVENCYKLINMLKEKNIEAKFISSRTVDETIKIFNKAKFVISTRFHGVLTAQALKSKTFALVYDKKVETLSNELNIDYIDISDCTKKEIDNKIKYFFNDSELKYSQHRNFHWNCIDAALEA